MAIKFKVDQGQPVKEPTSKLHKARTVLMVCAIIAFIIMILFMMVTLNPTLIFMPLLFVWIFTVVLPAVVTVGILFTNEGFKNYVHSITDMLGRAFTNIPEGMKIIKNAIPYVGSAMLLVVIAYGVISYFNYRKKKEEKKNMYHLIGSGALFILTLLFFILDIIFINRVA